MSCTASARAPLISEATQQSLVGRATCRMPVCGTPGPASPQLGSLSVRDCCRPSSIQNFIIHKISAAWAIITSTWDRIASIEHGGSQSKPPAIRNVTDMGAALYLHQGSSHCEVDGEPQQRNSFNGPKASLRLPVGVEIPIWTDFEEWRVCMFVSPCALRRLEV